MLDKVRELTTTASFNRWAPSKWPGSTRGKLFGVRDGQRKLVATATTLLVPGFDGLRRGARRRSSAQRSSTVPAGAAARTPGPAVARTSCTSIGASHSLQATTAVHVMAARRVVQDEERAFGASEPAVAPCRHRGQDGVGVPALLGEAVFVASGVLLILDPTQETLFHETGEPLGEDVAPDPELVLELVEAARAQARLADQQEVPMVAEHGSAPCDGAGPVRGIDALHRPSLGQRGAAWNAEYSMPPPLSYMMERIVTNHGFHHRIDRGVFCSG